MNSQTAKRSAAERRNAISAIAMALIVAAFVAWATAHNSRMWMGHHIMTWCACLAFGVQWLMFVHAWLRRSEHLFDLTGSATFLSLVWFAVLVQQAFDPHSLLLAGLISVWAMRLGTFLFTRIRRAGEDRRFRAIRNSFSTFLMTWTLQGLWVFLTASCALAAISDHEAPPLGPLVWTGVALWVAGFSIEVVADAQKSRFRADPANTSRFIRSGLWAWSRHPNYFGEILLWTGIAVIALPDLSGGQYVTLVSPVFVTLLLTKISGVRMLEARADKQWGEDSDYKAYKRATSVLVPLPPGRGQG
ncbi:MAG: DUF1295 domain-containing protein [Pseudomonadales bacterium]|nr:DUF1295 domain-containing protein [Pseudomonadales bacterium]MCP5182740.1 DUF1295 domain-containing protein [Pseudomonadales bacterium]